ncbi:uncharacterized protein EURHEDRAFT_218473 [Aspergillus ruber CBS 135680]|uniref:Uncharacterized protein n=1 Tax=Aspergillus ruber (strain CBS 135680) TaxID=1388766 RepID=A0A017SPA8_ASPRC|nr:uncharacterized protein EURHEDRAFT_218473 [Aspergillus ruber CBS 135680]EYE98621.1 hypothetical protein EURHEDRAFT_218473 [Aspergillus ruber CBS 135680]
MARPERARRISYRSNMGKWYNSGLSILECYWIIIICFWSLLYRKALDGFFLRNSNSAYYCYPIKPSNASSYQTAPLCQVEIGVRLNEIPASSSLVYTQQESLKKKTPLSHVLDTGF